MSGELVLMVEDNPLNAKLIRDVMGARGFEVLEATTAEDGLRIARERIPAVILMDIRLPGMDGITALRELKQDAATSAIPVIAVTASVMPMERSEVLAAGFDGFQPKPISLKNLLAEVSGVLKKSKSES